MKNVKFLIILLTLFTQFSLAYAECPDANLSNHLKELVSGVDICSEDGAFIILAKLLYNGEIYPVEINTNIESQRTKEPGLRRSNEKLALQIQEYCESIKSLKKEIDTNK